MDNLKKLIDLAKADGGKFFVLDESGNPVLAIMGISEYEKILVRKIQGQVSDIEEINKKIADAARQEALSRHQSEQDFLKSEVIDSTFSYEVPNRIEDEV